MKKILIFLENQEDKEKILKKLSIDYHCIVTNGDIKKQLATNPDLIVVDYKQKKQEIIKAIFELENVSISTTDEKENVIDLDKKRNTVKISFEDKEQLVNIIKSAITEKSAIAELKIQKILTLVCFILFVVLFLPILYIMDLVGRQAIEVSTIVAILGGLYAAIREYNNKKEV